jgi:AraC-like DNA-binding protein
MPLDISIKSKIERGILQNLQKGLLTTQDLADTLAVERSTLFRHIKQEFNLSPSALLKQKRLEYAAQILKQGRGTISEVAFDSGFESLSHFTRSFKAHYGVTPSEYLHGKRKDAP